MLLTRIGAPDPRKSSRNVLKFSTNGVPAICVYREYIYMHTS